MSAAAWTYRQNNGVHGLIKGVCTRIAERAGVPVWMPRAAFVIFGMLHWLLALVLYFVMERVMRAKAAPAYRAEPSRDTQSAVRDRFSALDKRLADMEAASLQQEAGLRRAFRDLERG